MIHRLISSIIVLFFANSFQVTAADQAFRPIYPRCDGKENPVGVSSKNLFFSWGLAGGADYAKQGFYRVVVASSSRLIATGSYDVWDSGEVESPEHVHVPYQGKRLAEGKRYYWKVMIGDAAGGRPSAWTEGANFVTATESTVQWQGSEWIGYEELPASDRLVPGIHTLENHDGITIDQRSVVPYFRKGFVIDKPVKEAFLSITGLGHYVPYVNGQRISTDFLTPGWTHYDKQVLFNTYELTHMLQQGDNVLGAVVGNGFHYVNHERYLKLGIAFGFPKMRCKLHIVYADGSEHRVVTDGTWKTAPSPTTYSSIFGGEDYDARKEEVGWDSPGFDDSAWQSAILVAPPGGKLEPETAYPLAVAERFAPSQRYKLNDSCVTYDFAQNASGIFEVRVSGRRGQRIRLWPGELLQEDRRVNQKASGAPHYYEYTLKGEGEEIWRPQFTYYGFRYITVDGVQAGRAEGKDTASYSSLLAIELLHTRSASPQVGTFACSSDLLNKIYHLIDWAIRSNMQSVITDCPHREKLGWLEQSYLMGNSIRYNYSVYHLYRKKIRDMIHGQRESGLIPSIVPEYVEFSGGFVDSPEWGSAAVILPWQVYKWYGDKAILEEAYGMMTRYVAYLGSKAHGHVLSHGLGDWFDYGPNPPGLAQLTPIPLTATASYYQDVALLSEIAALLGRVEDSERYQALAVSIKEAFNTEFYDEVRESYATESQTAIAMPLGVELVDDRAKEAVLASLRRSIEAGGYALTAGDIGFHYLVKALSSPQDADLLFRMINREDVPGYGYQLAKGATALTESWPALEEVSNNHLMLGHVMEWFYTTLLGIKDDSAAIASDKVVINPVPVGDITWASGSYACPRGEISVNWRLNEDKIVIGGHIPTGVDARIVVPAGYLAPRDPAALTLPGGPFSFEFKKRP